MIKITISLVLFLSLSFFSNAKAHWPESATPRQAKPLQYGHHSMIVTNNGFASLAASQILKQGGSAVDAAIAAAFVLGLTEPQSSGIGGGGYAVSYQKAHHRFIAYNGRECAPHSVTPSLFLTKAGSPLSFQKAALSLQSIGVPGEVALLQAMHQKAGRLPWASLVKPAIDLALKGFPMSPRLYHLLKQEEGLFINNPKVKRIFFRKNSIAPIHTRIKNKEYAESLRQIAVRPKCFYEGTIAKDITTTINRLSGKKLFSLNDFKEYRVSVEKALCSTYRSYTLCTSPGESGGVTLLELMNIFALQYSGQSPEDIEWIYQFLEASKLAYADKYQFIADPAFGPRVNEQLIDPLYIQERAKRIGKTALKTPAKAGILKSLQQKYASDITQKPKGTTSISIVDAQGNAVSLTLSIEQAFGSHVFVDGFFLNNELTDFSFTAKDSKGYPIANSPKAHKRPASGISPVLVFDKQKRLVAVSGSPGGSQISCYVAKNLIYLLDFNKNPKESSEVSNLCSLHSKTIIEAGTSFIQFIPALQKRGENIKTRELVSGVTNIKRDATGWLGAADPRREGVAIGQ